MFLSLSLSLCVRACVQVNLVFSLATVHDIVTRGGRCLIPVFALGRAQELLLILGKILYYQVYIGILERVGQGA